MRRNSAGGVEGGGSRGIDGAGVPMRQASSCASPGLTPIVA